MPEIKACTLLKDEKGKEAEIEKIRGVWFLVYRKNGRITRTLVMRKVDLAKCARHPKGITTTDKKINHKVYTSSYDEGVLK